ncbi:MAG: hypothetical protein O7H41_00275 [Planctomycetota bacterium]|nr:hypothetical protein [Planctomycetota bacterium]
MAAKKSFNLIYPLVVSIMLNLGLIGLVFSVDSKLKEQTDIARAETSEAKDSKEATRKAQREARILKELITGSREGSVSPEIIKGTHFRDWTEQARRIAELRGTDPGEIREITNLQEVYDVMKEDLLWQAEEIARLKTDRSGARNEVDAERTSKEELRTEKDSQLKDLSEQLTREQNSHQEDNRSNSSEIQRLTDDKGDLAASREELRRSYEIKVAELETLLSEKEQRIATLVKKQEQTLATASPDGEVLFADNEMRLAWIDLGRTHGITRGLPFDVYQVQKGGRRKHKGRIEILDVEDHLSTVSIIQTVDGRDPIVKGDFVISPLFDKTEQKIFVMLGEMVNPQYSEQEIIRKIEDAGGKVDSQVTVETDYIVAGKHAEDLPAFEKALQLGIRVMREPELLRFLAP